MGSRDRPSPAHVDRVVRRIARRHERPAPRPRSPFERPNHRTRRWQRRRFAGSRGPDPHRATPTLPSLAFRHLGRGPSSGDSTRGICGASGARAAKENGERKQRRRLESAERGTADPESRGGGREREESGGGGQLAVNGGRGREGRGGSDRREACAKRGREMCRRNGAAQSPHGRCRGRRRCRALSPPPPFLSPSRRRPQRDAKAKRVKGPQSWAPAGGGARATRTWVVATRASPVARNSTPRDGRRYGTERGRRGRRGNESGPMKDAWAAARCGARRGERKARREKARRGGARWRRMARAGRGASRELGERRRKQGRGGVEIGERAGWREAGGAGEEGGEVRSGAAPGGGGTPREADAGEWWAQGRQMREGRGVKRRAGQVREGRGAGRRARRAREGGGAGRRARRARGGGRKGASKAGARRGGAKSDRECPGVPPE